MKKNSSIIIEPGKTLEELITHQSTDVELLSVSIAENAQGIVSIDAKDVIELDIEVFLAPHSKLTLLCLQDGKTDAVIRQRSSVEEGASLHCQIITLGSGTVDHNLLSEITGTGGKSTIDWVFYAKDKEQQMVSARNVFNAKNGGGEITMKGVAEGEAKVTVNGMIDIGLEGGGTDAYLTEDVLMLDPSAKVDAIPGLEIKTNDVKASHSATVSRVSEEDLFYFHSRGIPSNQARHLYILGFLSDLLETPQQPEYSKNLVKLIEEKYAN